MREELPDDDGVVQRSDQPQPTPTIRARENVNPERPVHEGGPTPGARTALRLYTLGPRSQQRQAAGSGATRPYPTTRSRQRARAASRPWQINRFVSGRGVDPARFLEAQRGDLLPVQYFHVVFTVPTELHDLFLAAPPVAYRLLFTAVAQTLQQVARRRLGITIAFTAILHTWTQLLLYHPHLHCIVPGGGLDAEHTSWISTRPDFFLPVRVLSEVFRGKLLARFEHAIARATIPSNRDHDARDRLKRAAARRWVVYCKPPFAGPHQVLTCLARYTHRIALSNERLVSLREGHVC